MASATRKTEVEPALRPFHEVNERCIEMLVQAARRDHRESFPLVSELRDLLKSLPSSARSRAAQRGFLLVDLEFSQAEWWHTAANHPSKPLRALAWRGSFPRPAAIQLARTTLMLAWHGLRADPVMTGLLLGMTPPVAELIGGLRFDEIDRIAEKHFRHARPRWDDRPAVWRKLLLAAQAEDAHRLRDVDVHGLQLLSGDLLTPLP